MFLKLDAIKGEAKDKSHPGDIDILAWSWGVSNSGTTHAGGGGGGGKANFQDISVTKWVDVSSTALLLSAANGKHIKTATLFVRKAGETPLEYIIIKMSECLITSVSTGGSGGEDRLTENVTINFKTVEFDYFEQGADGKSAGGTPFKWDISANHTL
jgi:type VI secretion system secreted protein Hcp